MTSTPCPIRIELTLAANQPMLLEGLGYWQELGLLSDDQVRSLCQTYLVCPLPEVQPPTVSPKPDFIPDRPPPQRRVLVRAGQPLGGGVAQRFQALMEEISIIWLLFLGVFLVVVSSGVLAASQWQRFSATGQYAVLWGYTLAFWGASLWAARQPSLRLTARMLHITTLLIIPINFWLMDSLGLGRQLGGLAIALIAALSLTVIQGQVIRSIGPMARHLKWIIVNAIALSWLHWGWAIAGVPLAAVYLGTVGTAVALLMQQPSTAAQASPTAQLEGTPPVSDSTPIQLAIALATLILMLRAIWVADVPIAQMGLAMGIAGWLLVQLSYQLPILWRQVGVVLLLLGWLVSWWQQPWQALAVSVLGLWLLLKRLKHTPSPVVVGAIGLVGLQTYGLLWRLLPQGWQQTIVQAIARIAGAGFVEASLIGVAVFPYLWLVLWWAARLRRQQPALASVAERLVLGLGGLATVVCLFSPLMLAINLTLSAATLTVRLLKSPTLSTAFVYIAHALVLGAIAAWVDWLFPQLSLERWAIVALVGMGVEWGLSLVLRSPISQSAWFAGLALATISYGLLLSEGARFSDGRDGIWLVAPLALTLLSTQPQCGQPVQAARLSTVGFVAAQVLTIFQPLPRLVSLAVAAVGIGINSRRLRNLPTALLSVGFFVLFTLALIWQEWGRWLNADRLLIAIASITLLLWVVRHVLSRQSSELAGLYAIATDRWAVGLTLFQFAAISLGISSNIQIELVNSPDLLGATVVLLVALLYRTWQRPSEWGFWGIAGGVELLTTVGVLNAGLALPNRFVTLALANIGLGLATQLAGDRWVTLRAIAYRPSWHLIPLTYAALGCYYAHINFAATTGLYTIAAALVAIGIGRRHADLSPLTYLGLFGIAVALYEGVIYQLLQAKGGAVGDGLVLLAIVGGALALVTRLSRRFLATYLHLTQPELYHLAHFHWLTAGVLAILALFSGMSTAGGYLWIVVVLGLSAYALAIRQRQGWIYAGIWLALAGLAYLLWLGFAGERWLLEWAGAIAAGVAVALHSLPWHRWGWLEQPWHQSAMVLPGLALIATLPWGAIPCWLVVAAFYAWLANVRNQWRISYLSLVIADGALIRWLMQLSISDPLWYASIVGGSLLYTTEVDPELRSPDDREKRHWLRCLAVGLICLTAVYQAETSLWTAALTLAFCFGLVITGIVFKRRAYLYVGTVTLIVEVLRQLWLLINTYSLLIWAVGILTGLAFIWIAATFEARRNQVNAWVQQWATELDQWD